MGIMRWLFGKAKKVESPEKLKAQTEDHKQLPCSLCQSSEEQGLRKCKYCGRLLDPKREMCKHEWKNGKCTLCGRRRNISALIQLLLNQDRSISQKAANALIDCGEIAVEPLINASALNPSCRKAASEVLVKLGKPAVKPLIVALLRGNPAVCEVAADAIGQLADPEAVYPLIRATVRRYDIDVDESAKKIRDSADPEAAYTGLLGDFLKGMGNNVDVRGAARRAIYLIGAPAIKPLIESLSNSSWELRQNARLIIDDIVEDCDVEREFWAVEFEKLLGASTSAVRAMAARELGTLRHHAALNSLIMALRDENEYVRASAAYALGMLGDGQAVTPLVDVLTDQNYLVRNNVLGALRRLGDKRASESIAALLNHEHGWDDAARALAGLHDERAVKPLVRILTTPGCLSHYHDAQPILEELRTFGHRGIEPLIEALDRDEVVEGIRPYAAEFLGEIGDKRATQVLLKLCSQENCGIAKAAKEALKKLGSSNSRSTEK